MKHIRSPFFHLASVMAVACLAAMPARAALLMIDFGTAGSPVATGFVGQSAGSATHTTPAGNMTVAVTGQQQFFDRTIPTGTTQVDQFYRDFVFDNNADGFTIAISGPGISASTAYELTFYAYDSSEARRTAVAAASGTTGTKLQGFGGVTTAPTTLDQYSKTGTFTSNSSGVLTFFVDGSGPSPGTTGRSAINGFQISAVPEPGAALLGTLGAMLLLRRRR